MSAPSLWFILSLILSLSLSHGALAGTEVNGIVRLKHGDTITITCRQPAGQPQQQSLTLLTGLFKETDVLHLSQNSDKFTLNKRFSSRVVRDGPLDNLDITITNLTVGDTGVYWCTYSRFDSTSSVEVKTEGTGAVLLVVDGVEQCDSSLALPKYLILVSALTTGTVLLLCVLFLFFWLLPKMKARRARMVLAPARTNDVYEDMRTALRH